MIRSKLIRNSLLSSMILTTVAATAQEQELAPQSGHVVVYAEEFEIDEEGSILSAMTAGSLTVELDDGSLYELDPEDLADPDGNKYFIAGGAHQDSEFDPVTLSVRVVRYQPVEMTEEEVEEAWWAASPDASELDYQEFQDERALSDVAEAIPQTVEPNILEWHSDAGHGETLDVLVVLADQPRLDLPRVSNHLLEVEPAAWLEGMEQRLLAIEDRKTALYELQDDIVMDVESLGGVLVERLWAFNGVHLAVSPEALGLLIGDPRVRSLQTPSVIETGDYYHAGTEIREATQVHQYLDAEFDGRHGTGRSIHDEVYVLIVDDYIDVGHPAWRDGPGGDPGTESRLIDSWYWIGIYGGGGYWTQGSRQSWYPTMQHGNRVATQLIADLTEGQDPGDGGNSDVRGARSGQTPKAVFSFLEREDPPFGYTKFIEQAIWLNVDLINFSLGNASRQCDIAPDRFENYAVNQAMHDQIFVVQIAGNEGWSELPEPDCDAACTVRTPGAASGAFTIGALDHTMVPDLDDAPNWQNPSDCTDGSCRGGDPHGRPLLKINGIGGRQWNTGSPEYHPTEDVWVAGDPVSGHTYTSHTGTSTSRAAPVVTGAAANLRDFLTENMLWPHYLLVGHMFSHMMLMGDGAIPGGTQVASTPIDKYYGVGRMRMRLFTEEGMDAPWRWEYAYWVEDHGETYIHPLNWSEELEQNLPVPTEAEWLRVALWWHEPNLGWIVPDVRPVRTSGVSLEVHRPTGYYSCASLAPQSQRLWLGNVLGGETWEVWVRGLNIPPSTEQGYYQGQRKRPMFLAFYWEDRTRDDEDGPAPEDDIY